MSSAKFLIDGTPSSAAGFDALPGATLTLRLESLPALGVDRCVYSCPVRTAGSSAPIFNPVDGAAVPPSQEVEVTLPAGAHSFLLKCATNNGDPVIGADGRPDYSRNVFYRVVAVRTTTAGLRKVIVGESFQYDAGEGYWAAFNELVELAETLNSGGGLAVISVGGAAPITSTGGTAPVVGITPATSLAPGSMSAADKAKLDGASSSAGVDSIAVRDAVSGALRAAQFQASPTGRSTIGLVSASATETIVAARNAAGSGNFALLSSQGDDKTYLGDEAGEGTVLRAGAGKVVAIAINGPARVFASETALTLADAVLLFTKASISGAATPSERSTTINYHVVARSTGNTPFELFGFDLASTGDSVRFVSEVLVTVEGTHANTAAMDIRGVWQRIAGGASSRVSSAGGAQTALGENFAGAGPLVSLSDPSSAVAPNVLHRAAIIATGLAATNLLWIATVAIQRIKVT